MLVNPYNMNTNAGTRLNQTSAFTMLTVHCADNASGDVVNLM